VVHVGDDAAQHPVIVAHERSRHVDAAGAVQQVGARRRHVGVRRQREVVQQHGEDERDVVAKDVDDRVGAGVERVRSLRAIDTSSRHPLSKRAEAARNVERTTA
jgi:hypothetical protein